MARPSLELPEDVQNLERLSDDHVLRELDLRDAPAAPHVPTRALRNTRRRVLYLNAWARPHERQFGSETLELELSLCEAAE